MEVVLPVLPSILSAPVFEPDVAVDVRLAQEAGPQEGLENGHVLGAFGFAPPRPLRP